MQIGFFSLSGNVGKIELSEPIFDVVNYLSQKIRKGGAGVWGDVAMAAHPNIAESDLKKIIQYVVGLSNKTAAKPSLSASGTIIPPANAKPGTSLVLSASYTDKGGNNIKALTGRNSAALNAASISFTGKEKVNGFTLANYNGMNLMIAPAQPGWFALEGIDLTGVGTLNFMMGFLLAPKIGVDFEVHLDAENGKLLGKATFLPAANSKANFAFMPISIATITDGAMHTIYISSKRKEKETATVAVSSVQFVGK